ncbi:MAG: hypothetical protein MJ025_01570 [Victivallaceae bacterium]|nr:hypothetical protein [Victivallaceae bacterium]
MKKIMMMLGAALVVSTLAGCGSLRTPGEGKNADKVYYCTFFGLSIESAVYGDGFIVSPISNK